ncbi:Hypothetical_protein [Hexamita inflata]|uniref:Hypothetical_protein n=1 Tax=Hexamita inflata TaxID=28002 RepID=A0AA86NV57_9EUKA|nr:Hypothetical protein HINF_LOCUS13295 [Hexamita inflata]
MISINHPCIFNPCMCGPELIRLLPSDIEFCVLSAVVLYPVPNQTLLPVRVTLLTLHDKSFELTPEKYPINPPTQVPQIAVLITFDSEITATPCVYTQPMKPPQFEHCIRLLLSWLVCITMFAQEFKTTTNPAKFEMVTTVSWFIKLFVITTLAYEFTTPNTPAQLFAEVTETLVAVLAILDVKL